MSSLHSVPSVNSGGVEPIFGCRFVPSPRATPSLNFAAKWLTNSVSLNRFTNDAEVRVSVRDFARRVDAGMRPRAAVRGLNR